MGLKIKLQDMPIQGTEQKKSYLQYRAEILPERKDQLSTSTLGTQHKLGLKAQG